MGRQRDQRQRDQVRIGLKATDGRPVELMNFPSWAYRDHPGEGQPSRQIVFAVPGGERGWPATGEALASWGADGRAPFYDLDGYHRVTPAPNWFVWGRTPEGVRFRLETASIDEEPPRLLLTSGEHGRTTLAGVLNPDAALPIRVRLPEGGFVVAAVGAKLRYRLGGGAWLPLAGESALLPAGAAQVEVTKPGRPPEIVSLRP